jgi:hypothetical protein
VARFAVSELARPKAMDMNLDHGAGPGSRGEMGSDADKALQRFTRDLVLQLFLRRGPFWETVREMRSRWSISPKSGLPPKRPSLLYPEGTSGPEAREARRRWGHELGAVVRKTIPPRHNHADLEREWRSIVSACVFHDPPEIDLLAFAGRCVPRPYGLVPADKNAPIIDKGGSLPIMQAPPVRRLRDADAAEHTERWFWRRVLDEIGKRHLEPLGLDVWRLYDDVDDNAPGSDVRWWPLLALILRVAPRGVLCVSASGGVPNLYARLDRSSGVLVAFQPLCALCRR